MDMTLISPLRTNDLIIKRTGIKTQQRLQSVFLNVRKTSGENIFPKNMISPEQMNMIYVKTDSTVKNREYAFTKTFESVFDEDTFFNSCLQPASAKRSS